MGNRNGEGVAATVLAELAGMFKLAGPYRRVDSRRPHGIPFDRTLCPPPLTDLRRRQLDRIVEHNEVRR